MQGGITKFITIAYRLIIAYKKTDMLMNVVI